jgi:hypothetical protein
MKVLFLEKLKPLTSAVRGAPGIDPAHRPDDGFLPFLYHLK